jgi:pimeloyl-ACP methyl ester carboxylesterase
VRGNEDHHAVVGRVLLEPAGRGAREEVGGSLGKSGGETHAETAVATVVAVTAAPSQDSSRTAGAARCASVRPRREGLGGRFPRSSACRVDVDGVEVFYRQSLPDRPDAPVLLLLHGFPSASHQFRRLIDAIGARFRLIAPDYPGFGHTRVPDGFAYSFDHLTDVVEGFVDRLALDLFTLEATRAQYEGGTADPDLVAPEGWLLDQFFLDQPGRKQAQLALAYDYHRNVAAYPDWQAWLRDQQPPTLITGGVNDPFFTGAGARAYLRDLPGAKLHLLNTGHFALEDHLPQIAPLITDFLTGTDR